MAKRKSPHPTENQLQRSCVDYLRKSGVRGLIWYCVPNELARGGKLFHWLKMGLLPGMTDLVVLHAGKSIYFELKHQINGVVSDEQTKVHRRLKEQGFPVYIVRRIERFQDICVGEGLSREQRDV